MGVSVESGNNKGRKSVDAEINLIPFIDLLSVCILFLLMTAVWVQISKMSAFSQPSGQSIVHHSEVSSLNEAREARDFDVIVRKAGIQIVEDGKNIGPLYPINTFRDTLAKLKSRFTAKSKNPKIALRAEDEVLYDTLIQVLDSLFSQNYTNVTIGGVS